MPVGAGFIFYFNRKSLFLRLMSSGFLGYFTGALRFLKNQQGHRIMDDRPYNRLKLDRIGECDFDFGGFARVAGS